jgi:uncharacterized membrane protein
VTAVEDEKRETRPGRPRFERGLAWLYVVGGFAGLAAAFALTLEGIAELLDPGYVPTCSLNPVVSCGSVMESAHAQAFSFPNPLLGIGWLIYSSLYSIGALCPYCMVVWAVTIPMFWYTTLRNVEHGNPPGGRARVALLLARFHSVVLAAWYVVIALLILHAFWSYWTS